jgi:hypothetical protein
MDVRGELIDPVLVRSAGESFDRTFSVIWTALFREVGNDSAEQRRFIELFSNTLGEFDPGSGRTLAACLTHASHGGPQGQPANGCVTREQSADFWGIAGPTAG